MAELLICIWCNQPFDSQDVGLRAAFCCAACERVFDGGESAAAVFGEETRAALRPDQPDRH